MLPASAHPAVLVGLVLVAAALFRLHLWRAVLFVAPGSMKVEVDAPPGMTQRPPSLEATHKELLAAGLSPLGTHLEQARFGRVTLHFDYVSVEHHVFASLHEGRAGAPRLIFLTPTEGDGFAFTGNFRLRGREEKGHFVSGGLASVSVERLLNAHLRRVPEAGTPEAEWTLEGRVVAARTWYAATGKRDVRQQNAVGLLWTVGALGMVGAAFFGWSG